MSERKESREATLKRKLEDFEAGRREKFKDFNIDDFVVDADETLETLVPELDTIVKYKVLTNADLLKISRVEGEHEKGFEILFLLLSKADPNITREKLYAVEPSVTNRILAAITREKPIFLM